MSLPTWLAAGWLQPHKTSRAEIRELWQIVDRDLADAASGGHDLLIAQPDAPRNL